MALLHAFIQWPFAEIDKVVKLIWQASGVESGKNLCVRAATMARRSESVMLKVVFDKFYKLVVTSIYLGWLREYVLQRPALLCSGCR